MSLPKGLRVHRLRSGLPGKSAVTLWWRRSADAAREWEHCWEVLTPVERNAVGRMKMATAIDFVNRRSLMRTILASWMNCRPERLIVRKETYGRPWLDMPGAPGFSLSSSSGVAALAIREGGHIGLDIEMENGDFDFWPVALRYFEEMELKTLRASGPSGSRRLFYQMWTRKEALVKAQGGGLLMLEDRPGLKNIEYDHWSVDNLELEEGCIAAISLKFPFI